MKPKSRETKIPKPDMRGAAQAPMPATLSPQLATLTNAIPNAGDWLYEIKLDGYRLMTRFESGKPALITRNGHDWSAKMPLLVKELTNIGIDSGWLDGEVVVLRDDGVPDFNALQNAFDRRTGAGIGSMPTSNIRGIASTTRQRRTERRRIGLGYGKTRLRCRRGSGAPSTRSRGAAEIPNQEAIHKSLVKVMACLQRFCPWSRQP